MVKKMNPVIRAHPYQKLWARLSTRSDYAITATCYKAGRFLNVVWWVLLYNVRNDGYVSTKIARDNNNNILLTENACV